MNEVEKFWRDADEASDLWARFPAAYPVRRDMGALRRRWEANDPCVIKSDHGEDGGVVYEVQFTKDQKTKLERAYIDARSATAQERAYLDACPSSAGAILAKNEFEARVFVGIIEGWAGSIALFDAIIPESQKERKRAMESVIVAVTKLQHALILWIAARWATGMLTWLTPWLFLESN